MRASRSIVGLVASISLSGCGLFVPEMQEFPNSKDSEKFDENMVVNQIKCELHKGVQDTLNDPLFSSAAPVPGNSINWLRTWGAKVTLELTVDEKGSLNPGISLVEPFSAPSKGLFSLGIGVGGSADATRKETIGFQYAFADLLAEGDINGPCANEKGILIHSDLKIGDFIKNKAFVARVPGTIVSPYTAFNYEATFLVSYGGSATPSWQFVRLTVNPNGPFASASRSRTQHVIITLGQTEPSTPATPTTLAAPARVSREVEAVHDAAIIGYSVATAIQSLQP
jgi:hypothetical protein